MPTDAQFLHPRTLRLLMLEDRASDAELVWQELRRAGFDPVGPRVDTEADFLAQLNSGWDLIISDYALPHFDALRALAHVTEQRLDVPFIMVSGSVGEDIAVLAIQQGAADYLLKDRLGRLGDAVRRALEARQLHLEREHASDALLYSETRLRVGLAAGNLRWWELALVTRQVTGSSALSDSQGVLAESTRFGYDDMLKQVHPDDLVRLLEADRRAIDDNLPYEVEFRFIESDGRVRWLAERGEISERDPNGQALRMIGITSDITDRMLAGELLQRSEAGLAEAQRLARIGSWEWELGSDHVTWSAELYRMF